MVKIKSTTKFERKNKFFLLFNAQVLIFRNLSNKLLEIKCKRKHLLLKVGPSVYEKEVNCIEADMRIVASTASMLEEPYWRIEEPNPLMAEQSKARKRRK